MAANIHNSRYWHTVIMNIFIICFLGSHLSNALQNSDEQFEALNYQEDYVQKSHQFQLRISPNLSRKLHKSEPMLLNLFMNKKHFQAEPNEIGLTSILWDYIIRAQNYQKVDKVNIIKKREIKPTMFYPKIIKEERNSENLNYFDSSSFYDKITNFPGYKSHKSLGKVVLIVDVREIHYSDKESQSLFADNLNFESLEGTQKQDMSEKDTVNVLFGTKSIYHKLKNRENAVDYSKSGIKSELSSVNVVKRSSPSANTREIETPAMGNFPFSTAGSSLYGSYAYAHTRPSGLGILPPFGEEGGVIGEPIEGAGEGEEVVNPIEGGEERVE